jgi:uncharacterized protein (TIGR02996 family)
MSDHDALLAAVIANPADDLPRLVYADWIEENGEPDRAAFIRGQVELARTPPWEPLAVRARLATPALATGRPWYSWLPDLGDQASLAWDREHAFRRGFGWGLAVRFPRALADAGEGVFAAAPVGRLALWPATLDDWRAVARCPWLVRVTAVNFAGLVLPNEPLWLFGESPHATGLTEIEFERADSPGMPEVVARLMQSPIGPRLTRLSFRNGPGAVEDMIDALAAGDVPARLNRLDLVGGNLTRPALRRLLELPASRSLTELGLENNPLEWHSCRTLGYTIPFGLLVLNLRNCAMTADSVHVLADRIHTSLRRLDLTCNPLGPDGVAEVAVFAELRSLRLQQVGAGDAAVRPLVESRLWKNLVELDLRTNRITDAGAKALLDAPVPPELAALRLEENLFGDQMKAELRRHFGDRVTLAPGW